MRPPFRLAASLVLVCAFAVPLHPLDAYPRSGSVEVY